MEIKSEACDSKNLGNIVILHCFCTECNRVVLQKEKVPNEVLEMSFFKLLEQFFYNH